ncbi:tRNA pseudouridine(55) synthase TruB [Thermoleophilia bacterium SCSIO 60948]|nr:tRNA pseudouridine(55) synthase TruB [Thermoleophilia bacterium SCSIO 60948]
MPVEGVLICDKPAGTGSSRLVDAARRRFGVKCGHAGTLDPFADGLLVVLIGRSATRQQARFMELDKAYEVRARLGARSETGDPEGPITETGLIPPLDGPLPTGRITQVPPRHSAVRVGGRRGYALARAGVEVEMPPRHVDVSRFDCVSNDGREARFEIECSSGTYVRSLIADLPGGDAYCLELRRTRIGPFRVEEADERTPLELGSALERIDEASRLAHERERARALERRRRAAAARLGER